MLDTNFYKKKKNGSFNVIEAPKLAAPVADSHAHLEMLDNPSEALARAGAHGVQFIEAMVDPAEGTDTYKHLEEWLANVDSPVPRVRLACGVHPHNAKEWNATIEQTLLHALTDPRTSAVGEIGLDYHYDKSPRDVQQHVFRRQMEIAHEAELPSILHVREAFDDAFEIMEQVGWNPHGVLLHCYTSGHEELARWIDAGCSVAFGGAATFGKSDDIRAALAIVPQEKLLFETDAPFMTPVPLRGEPCEPAHVIFTAEAFSKDASLDAAYANTLALLDKDPTTWQLSHFEQGE